MAGQESLENLIEGLAGAVVEAQRRIEDHQLKNFKSYFDEDDRPKKIDIRVPSLDPNAKPDEDALYRVPLLPIVASSLLRIKDVEITFDADLVGLTGEEAGQAAKKSEKAEDKKDTGDEERKKSVSVDIRGGMFKRKTGTVHVVLKVEGRELSEGMARVIDRLVQVQGEVKTE